MIIFAILVITGLSVQRANIDRLQNIRNTNNFLKAKSLSKSVLGRLQQIMNKYDAGYNLSVHCEFSGGALNEKASPLPDSKFCETNFLKVVNPCTISTYSTSQNCKDGHFNKNEIVIDAEIKGRNTGKIDGQCLSFLSGCYTVPPLGEGSAGDRHWMPVKNSAKRDCSLYEPTGTASDLDHECNWNRLSFGSTATDRVVIPMYYTDGNGAIVEPIKTGGFNENFILRVRTPCKKWDEATGECNERYSLYTGTNNVDNDIILQWQITGTCDDGQDCGILPFIKFDSGRLNNLSSGIDERRINGQNFPPFEITNEVLTDEVTFISLLAISSINYSATNQFLGSLLGDIYKPSFNLFLSHPLISTNSDEFIPYLEYQFLTPFQISSPKAKMDVLVKFNGNSSSASLEKTVSGALIDFAVQN